MDKEIACKADDLTKMTIHQIVDFARKALTDWPSASLAAGFWMRPDDVWNHTERELDHRAMYGHGDAAMFEEQEHRDAVRHILDVPTLEAIKQREAKFATDMMANGKLIPERVKVCAVGAVLASDGAQAAFDWLLAQETKSWRAGYPATALFWAVSDMFEHTVAADPGDLDAARWRAIEFLDAVKEQAGKLEDEKFLTRLAQLKTQFLSGCECPDCYDVELEEEDE